MMSEYLLSQYVNDYRTAKIEFDEYEAKYQEIRNDGHPDEIAKAKNKADTWCWVTARALQRIASVAASDIPIN